jgi:hypothetical protein
MSPIFTQSTWSFIHLVLNDVLIDSSCTLRSHNHRPANYSPSDYYNEFGIVVQGMDNDTNIEIRPPNNLIAPSVATGSWTPEMVWDTGFIPTYSANLGALAVEQYVSLFNPLAFGSGYRHGRYLLMLLLNSYPNDNCYAQYGIGSYQDPEQVFPTYLNHTASTLLVAPYLNSTSIAQQAGKPFLMFETNTASCGGFPGISDSFGSTLWAVDYALQMAYSNFSGALLHVGGQDDYYNVSVSYLSHFVALANRFTFLVNNDSLSHVSHSFPANVCIDEHKIDETCTYASAANESIDFPPMDRRPHFLFDPRRRRGARPNGHGAGIRSPGEQWEHVHACVCDL